MQHQHQTTRLQSLLGNTYRLPTASCFQWGSWVWGLQCLSPVVPQQGGWLSTGRREPAATQTLYASFGLAVVLGLQGPRRDPRLRSVWRFNLTPFSKLPSSESLLENKKTWCENISSWSCSVRLGRCKSQRHVSLCRGLWDLCTLCFFLFSPRLPIST